MQEVDRYDLEDEKEEEKVETHNDLGGPEDDIEGNLNIDDLTNQRANEIEAEKQKKNPTPPRNNNERFGRVGRIKKAKTNTREMNPSFKVNVNNDEVKMDEFYFLDEDNAEPVSQSQSVRPSDRSAAGPAENNINDNVDDLLDRYNAGAVALESQRKTPKPVEKPDEKQELLESRQKFVKIKGQNEIDTIINNLMPDEKELNNDIDTRVKKNDNELKNIKFTETYKACTKELMDSLKTNLGTTMLKDMDERYTKYVTKTFATDEFAVLLSSSQDINEDSHIKTLRKKIIGKDDVSVKEYVDTLTKYAKYNQLLQTATFDPNDKENKQAYNELVSAVCLTMHILIKRGMPNEEAATLLPNEERILVDSTCLYQKNIFEHEINYMDTNDIPDNIIQSTEAHLDLIFERSSIDTLPDDLLQAYRAGTQDGFQNVDVNDYQQAKKIIEGNPINSSNMSQAFKLLSKLTKTEYVYKMHDPKHPNLKALQTALMNTKDLLHQKGLSSQQIETLTNLSNDNVAEDSIEFNKEALKILAANEIKRTANTPIKEALDKFYTELAITFDAANNKYGKDLTTDTYVSAAKTFKKMTELQDAYYQMKSTTKLDEINRHVAKIEKFLLLKGFTEKEISAIKSPDIYTEDITGLDGFQKLADRHWDIYVDNDKEVENNIVEKTDIKTDTPKRTNIEIIVEPQAEPTLDDVTLFDETKKYMIDNNLEIEKNENGTEISEDEFNIDNIRD